MWVIICMRAKEQRWGQKRSAKENHILVITYLSNPMGRKCGCGRERQGRGSRVEVEGEGEGEGVSIEVEVKVEGKGVSVEVEVEEEEEGSMRVHTEGEGEDRRWRVDIMEVGSTGSGSVRVLFRARRCMHFGGGNKMKNAPQCHVE